MIRKVRNCCETCENLVCVATTIGQLQHTEYLKPTFLDDTFKWAIRPVFPETVTYMLNVSSGCAHNFVVSAIMSILYQHSCDNNSDFTLKLMLVHRVTHLKSDGLQNRT